jgi:hypothetical protein
MKIDDYSFGEISIAGKLYTSDLKILGEKILPNWWRKEGHLLQLEDIEDILEFRPDVLVVASGAYGLMKVEAGVERYLRSRNIKCEVSPTPQACREFNRLLESGLKLAGCFHLGC